MFADIKPKASRLTSTFSLFRSNYSLFETRVPTGSRSALSRIVTWQAMGSHGADPRVYSFLCVHRHTSAVCLLICHWRPAPHSCHRRPSLDMGVETYLYAIIVDSVGSHGIFVYDTKVYRTTQLFVARKKKCPYVTVTGFRFAFWFRHKIRNIYGIRFRESTIQQLASLSIV